MTRYDIDGGIPTLAAALSEHMNADELNVLARLTRTSAPTRKAELVEHICRYLEGERPRTVWQGLDDLQKAAVAEVVHSPATTFQVERFRAKYSRLPDFGALSRWPRDQPPSALRFFFYGIEHGGGVILRDRLTVFVPPPVATAVKSLDELPAAYDPPFERWNARTRCSRRCASMPDTRCPPASSRRSWISRPGTDSSSSRETVTDCALRATTCRRRSGSHGTRSRGGGAPGHSAVPAPHALLPGIRGRSPLNGARSLPSADSGKRGASRRTSASRDDKG